MPDWMIEDEADEYLATQPHAAEDLVERPPPRPLQISEAALRTRIRGRVAVDFGWSPSLCHFAPIQYHSRNPPFIGAVEVRYGRRGDTAVYRFTSAAALRLTSGSA